MAYFKFIGDPQRRGHGPDEMFMFGTLFRKGHVSEVADPRFAAKLKANRHFVEVEPDKGSGRKPETARVDAEGAPSMDWTKEQMLGYAKERFGVTLEARDTKEKLLESLKKLAEEAAYRKSN